MDSFDSRDKIDYILYRQHTIPKNGYAIKDLSLLNRDLSKIIIIDNIEENYMLQQENGLNIIDFEGDENDEELRYILEDLISIVSLKNIDIRDYLPQIRTKMKERYLQF